MYTLILDDLELNVLTVALSVSLLMSTELLQKEGMTTIGHIAIQTQNAVEETLLALLHQMQKESPSE